LPATHENHAAEASCRHLLHTKAVLSILGARCYCKCTTKTTKSPGSRSSVDVVV